MSKFRVRIEHQLNRPRQKRPYAKPRRQRQRERHQTKGLMSRSMAEHVCYNSWYISLPSSANQQRKMANIPSFLTMGATTANFSYFHLELNAFVAYSAAASFNTGRHTEYI